MDPCLSVAYRSVLPGGAVVTVAEPWGDPRFDTLAREHTAEVWGASKELAHDFAGRLASEHAQGRIVPIIALADIDGRPGLIGYNILGYMVSPLTGEAILGDWGLFVTKDYRRSGVALGMLEAQKDAARQLRVSECYAGYVSVHAHGLQKLYEAAGFHKSMIGFTWRTSDVIPM